MAEKIYGEDDGNSTSTNGRESISPSDVEGTSYIDFTSGTEVLMEVASIERNYGAKYTLSMGESDDEPYAVEITDVDGETVSLTSWRPWGMVKSAIREALSRDLIESDDYTGLELHLVNGEDRGEYEVRWKAGDMEEFEVVDDE